jgi:hypothetical protein
VSPWSNGRLHQRSTAVDCAAVWSVRSQKTVCDVRSYQTVRCTKRIDDFSVQQLQTPTIDWRGTHRTVNNRVSGAHRTVPCAHRQTKQPTTRMLVGAINTPNHLHSSKPSFPLSTFNTRSNNTIQRYIQSLQSSPSAIIKSSDQKCLVTWERVICVSFVSLVAWLLCFSSSYLSKCFVKQERDT